MNSVEQKEINKEIISILNNLEPNRVFTLSDKAGKYFFQLVKKMCQTESYNPLTILNPVKG